MIVSDQEILGRLRREVTDRPAHARFLEQLIEHYASGGDGETEPDPTGRVSWEVQVALGGDVSVAFMSPEPGQRTSVPRSYHDYRAKNAVAAEKRRQTIGSQPLGGLLQIQGDR